MPSDQMTGFAGAPARPLRQIFVALTSPTGDRLLAITAIAPFVWGIYRRTVAGGWDFAWLALDINMVLQISLMLARRPPTRVTPNPLYWALAFLATYWSLLAGPLMERGEPIAPAWLSELLGVAAPTILVWARLSLGRNIGFVPAQRDLVMDGAYRFVRHPIYTGIFLAYGSLLLRSFSGSNAVIFGCGCLWFVIKSFVEEGFLRQDPAYARYLRRVRWRWVPGLA